MLTCSGVHIALSKTVRGSAVGSRQRRLAKPQAERKASNQNNKIGKASHTAHVAILFCLFVWLPLQLTVVATATAREESAESAAGAWQFAPILWPHSQQTGRQAEAATSSVSTTRLKIIFKYILRQFFTSSFPLHFLPLLSLLLWLFPQRAFNCKCCALKLPQWLLQHFDLLLKMNK